MVAVRESIGIANDLEALASSLDGLDLTAEPSLHDGRERLIRTIRSYLIPRFMTPGRALTVVFAGPTGSGKSTLVNSLAGLEVSETGPIRPTTREPVVLGSKKLTHDLGTIGGVSCHVVTGSAPILDQVSLVDTPDIDSTARDHRATAEVLIDNADVVVFVTSALRYADATPWEVLRRAQSRGAPLLFVLNRVSVDSAGAYVDFTTRLRAAGLEQQVLRVPEHHLSESSHAVPALAVRELRRQLETLARDNVQQGREILDRVLAATISQTSGLIDDVDDLSATRELEAETIRAEYLGRFAHLDFSRGFRLPPISAPKRDGWWPSWRWRRANRLSPEAASAVHLANVEATARAVESDIGRVAVETGADPALVMTAVRPVVGEALSGWLDGLHPLIEQIPERDRPLAGVVLVQMALTRSGLDAGRALFGIGRDLVTGRARSALADRLDIAYAHAAELAVAQRANLDTGSVADRLASVVVRSHFADA